MMFGFYPFNGWFLVLMRNRKEGKPEGRGGREEMEEVEGEESRIRI